MPSRTRKNTGSRDELSRLLVAARGNLRQEEAGALVGLSQTKVSRAENGQGGLTPEQVEAYCRALGAPAAVRKRIVELTRTFAAGNVTSRTTLVRKATSLQERFAQLEAEVTEIRAWQPEIVPGDAQLPEYTAAVVPLQPDAAWWAARAARTVRVGEPGARTWHLLISEATLRWGLGSPEVMAAQMRHLVELSRRPTVNLGIVPLDVVHPVAPPAAFTLFGTRVATVATEAGTAFIDDSGDVQHHRGLFDGLQEIALTGDDARALLERLW